MDSVATTFAATEGAAASPLSPTQTHSPPGGVSPTHQEPDMGATSPPVANVAELQGVIDQQATTITKLHEAFGAEREVWKLERKSLYQRITNLEKLLRTGDHHSPAKSPIMSPSLTSPLSRTTTGTQRLPSIAEDENIPPLSRRREGAPQSLELPPIPTITHDGRELESSVSFASGTGDLMVDEVPISPPTTAQDLSPVPPNNLTLAGHTPLKAPRVPTPPPQSLSMEAIEDTPTRNNTHINALLTLASEGDDDVALKGPLNMPELPNRPDETNFTIDALTKKLAHVASHPEDNESRPMIYSEPSPGMMSPAESATGGSDAIMERMLQGALEPLSTRGDGTSLSELSSNALSPTNGAPLSQQESREKKLHSEFEQGGIKLKKKSSMNFGAPLGQLSGWPPRKLS